MAPASSIFEGPDDEHTIKLLQQDPLGLQRVEFRMSYSVSERRRPQVPFEACRTPVQVIASENNKLWPYKMVKRNFERLGGPKELITLEGKPMW